MERVGIADNAVRDASGGRFEAIHQEEHGREELPRYPVEGADGLHVSSRVIVW